MKKLGHGSALAVLLAPVPVTALVLAFVVTRLPDRAAVLPTPPRCGSVTVPAAPAPVPSPSPLPAPFPPADGNVSRW